MIDRIDSIEFVGPADIPDKIRLSLNAVEQGISKIVPVAVSKIDLSDVGTLILALEKAHPYSDFDRAGLHESLDNLRDTIDALPG